MRLGRAAELKFSLVIGQANTSVTVEAGEDLVETDPTTHTDVDRRCSTSCRSKASRLR